MKTAAIYVSETKHLSNTMPALVPKENLDATPEAEDNTSPDRVVLSTINRKCGFHRQRCLSDQISL